MTISHKAQYLAVTAAVLAASAVQVYRGVPTLIIVMGAIAFLFVGNGVVYLSGSAERARRRKAKRDFYEGRS